MNPSYGIEEWLRISLSDKPIVPAYMSQPRQHAFIVEHMEAGMFPWCIAEYKAIANTVGAENFHLTSLPKSLLNDLPKEFRELSIQATSQPITKLAQFSKERVCLLDLQAEQVLSPDDAEKFDCFLFGGILGDDPPRDRTAELRALGFSGRNLRDKQMTTDTAVAVTILVTRDKIPINEIPYIDFPELRFSKHEAVEMPFRYIQGNDAQPVLPEGMRELIRKDADSALDFN
ncbi:Protein arginine N-methyltransferase SFM1 [Neolecta irregularis DAH-3]|uniref:Protein arginine N-methyltransferase SFM1 n=1 Tax=Neolecta irregularis (strain DAH-3) TaxID=1198029 RepID=A0A1U7LWB9_NEOID|nr:Protein arginine N-methyltransferase SFM1 [Neolecta irregularis DAH-3]|eukprot:OLL26801.1 Protein arginine N-methyltransferase SFM1 [Neolecta irregularis DAH-3]